MEKINRLFIAIEINPSDFFLKKYSQLKCIVGNTLKWVNPDNLHLTLIFLGNQTVIAEKIIQNQLAEINFNKFHLRFQGLSGFFRNNALNVLFIPCDVGQEIYKLQKILTSKLQAENIAFDKKNFHPHLTLARSSGYFSKSDAEKLFEACKDIVWIETEVKEITLYKSTLLPTGAVYEKRFVKSLR